MNFQLFLSSLSSQHYACYLCACTPKVLFTLWIMLVTRLPRSLSKQWNWENWVWHKDIITSIFLLHLTTSFVSINSMCRSVWANMTWWHTKLEVSVVWANMIKATHESLQCKSNSHCIVDPKLLMDTMSLQLIAGTNWSQKYNWSFPPIMLWVLFWF